MDPFYRIVRHTLALPGVRGTHRFLHISDTHINCIDEISTPAEADKARAGEAGWMDTRAYFADRFHEPFLPAHHIPGSEALHKLLAYAKQEQPERLLLSGDILDYIHPAGLRFLTQALADYGDGYLFVPGNHEGNYADNPCLLSFNGGSDDVTVYAGDGFLIAAVDDSERTLSDRQLAAVQTLAAGETPVILLMHVPVMTDHNRAEMEGFGEYFSLNARNGDDNARAFLETLTRPDSAIRGIVCGHLHGYVVTQYAPGRTQIGASSGLVGFIHELTVTGK